MNQCLLPHLYLVTMSAPSTEPATAPDRVLAPHHFTPEDSWTLISQGAEAKIWKIPNFTDLNAIEPTTAIAKERFSKSYRHPVLDERLTKQRCRAEARILGKCLKKEMDVPKVLKVDAPVIYLEFIQGTTVRDYLEQLLHQDGTEEEVMRIGKLMGRTIGKLHSLGVVHGDLTTSNMMVRDEHKKNQTDDAPNLLTLIDFGLAKNTESAEERAVDLYVLERALTSTHPKLPEDYLDTILQVYQEMGADRKFKTTITRLEQVRLRGRKRECFG